MSTYEVVKPWSGVQAGQIVEIENLHPALRSNVRSVKKIDAGDHKEADSIIEKAENEAKDLLETTQRLVDTALAESAVEVQKIVADANAERDEIVAEAKEHGEEIIAKAKEQAQKIIAEAEESAKQKGTLTPATPPGETKKATK